MFVQAFAPRRKSVLRQLAMTEQRKLILQTELLASIETCETSFDKKCDYAMLWSVMPKKTLISYLAACGLMAGIAASRAADKTLDVAKIPPAAAKTGVTFATDIKPILDQSCIKCHGADKPKAKLRLDSLEGALKGSEHGKVIAPGKATESQLLVSIAHQGDPDLYMPPPNNKARIPPLTPSQVGLIRAWIDQGAK
jgi:mono/diheme cytochrome c family protein